MDGWPIVANGTFCQFEVIEYEGRASTQNCRIVHVLADNRGVNLATLGAIIARFWRQAAINLKLVEIWQTPNRA